MIELVKQLIEEGNIEQAKNIIKQRNTFEIKESVIHFQWAKIFEELNLIDELILELNLAIKYDSKNITYYKKLAEVYNMQSQNNFESLGLTIGTMQFYKALEEYIKLKQKMREIEILIDKYEKVFEEVFNQTQEKEINTPLGKLEQVISQTGKKTYQLKI